MSEPLRKTRRTQAERSAGTRGKLRDAAIRCLRERGYAATTTLLVAEEAGVSRGAMLHQFPTKVDLMLFVVREVYRQELAVYAELLGAIDAPAARLEALPEIVWDVLSRPSGVAVLEIMQGARSDPVLAERLRSLQGEIETDSLTQIAHLDRLFGRSVSPAAMRLVVWAVRGLSIAQMLTDDPQAIGESVRLLRVFLQPAPEPSAQRPGAAA